MSLNSTQAPAINEPADVAANLAFFLLEKTGTVCGQHGEHMRAAEQRALFGRFIGKGTIIINGDDETIRNRVKVCFGHDYDDRTVLRWSELSLAA